MSLNLNNFLNTVNSVTNTINTGVRAIQTISSAISDPISFISNTRLQGLPVGAETQTAGFTSASWSMSSSSAGNDWRVRLQLPSVSTFQTSPILQPLKDSDNSLVFPVTPQVMVTHSASYSALAPVHSNYPFPIYQNSQVEDITITGEFPVENEQDGRYWIAAVHFLRSITKMFYGQSSNPGAPPPISYLSGYGDFVFNKVPVVVKTFTMDLRDGVDYIQVPIGENVDLGMGYQRQNVPGGYSYVPTLSTITVTLMPTFSRTQVRTFSLDQFINGGYIGNNSSGTGGGFI